MQDSIRLNSSKAFEQILYAAKRGIAADFRWYPYPSLAAVPYQIGPLLRGHEEILTTAQSQPLLDLGCGDGDLSFFFESLGFRVVAVDYEGTNYNRMQGVRALRDALRSSVQIISADLDSRFEIEGGPFGMVLMSGLLYHLKNPFYVLEYAARAGRYGLLTTRIIQQTPANTPIHAEPLAYLVDVHELGGDATNYWILSAKGLQRLVTRAGWEICEFLSTGCRTGSNLTPDGDERACCLLRSRFNAD